MQEDLLFIRAQGSRQKKGEASPKGTLWGWPPPWTAEDQLFRSLAAWRDMCLLWESWLGGIQQPTLPHLRSPGRTGAIGLICVQQWLQ